MSLTPLLPLRAVVPSWTLPDLITAQPFSLYKPRGRAHTLLVMARSDVAALLADLAAPLADLATLPARGVAVLGATPAAPVAGWTVVLDGDGTTLDRYLPPEAQIGVFVLDRYNDLYHQWLVAAPAELPASAELAGWLEAVGQQCGV